MIRFVDLTAVYWTHPANAAPICAFLDTVTDTFITSSSGDHTFSSTDDLSPDPVDAGTFVGSTSALAMQRELYARCRALVPEGFFK